MKAPNVTFTVSEGVIERAKALLERKTEQVKPHKVTVGLHQEEGAQDKLGYDYKAKAITLIEVMTAHEFGIPDRLTERSWLRTWFDRNRARLEREMFRVMRAEYRGNKDEVKRQAEAWAKELRAWVEEEEGRLPSIAPVTIDDKEHHKLPQPETPLVATKQFVSSLKAKVDE